MTGPGASNSNLIFRHRSNRGIKPVSDSFCARLPRPLCALVGALAGLLVIVAPASAAPQLAVEISHSPTAIARNDEGLLYSVRLKNDAPVNPAAGETVTCNGAPPPDGTKAWAGATSFSYQWTSGGARLESAEDIAHGSQTETYTVQAGDAGKVLQCLVEGTNEAGTGSFVSASQSQPTLVAGPAPAEPAPVLSLPTSVSRRPSISGPLAPGVETGALWEAGNELKCTAPTGLWTTIVKGTTSTGTEPNVVTAVASARGGGFTGAAGSGPEVLTNVSTFEGRFRIGQTISGSVAGRIPPGTTITAINENAKTITLSNPTSGTGNVQLTAGALPLAVGETITATTAAGVSVVPPGTTIVAVNGQSVTLSNPASVSATNVQLSTPASGVWSFQWLRNGEVLDPAHATNPTSLTSRYTLQASDLSSKAVFQCLVTDTNPGGKTLVESSSLATQAPAPAFGTGADAEPNQNASLVNQFPTLEFANSTSGPVTLDVELPQGQETHVVSVTPPAGWVCTSREPGATTPAGVSCETGTALLPAVEYPFSVRAAVGADAPDPLVATAAVSGGGSAPDNATDQTGFLPPTPFAITAFEATAKDASGAEYTQAGGHPFAVTAAFSLSRRTGADGLTTSVEFLKDVVTDAPPGFIGNPTATPSRCESVEDVRVDEYETPLCPRSSVIGGAEVEIANSQGIQTFENLALYEVRPERGAPAQFAFVIPYGKVVIPLTARLRPQEGYAISIDAAKAPKAPALVGAAVTLCGFGGKVQKDLASHLLGAPEFAGCKPASEGGLEGANPKPFLANPTNCSVPVTRLSIDSWDHPGATGVEGGPDLSDRNWHSATWASPRTSGCEQVPFGPRVDLRPTSHRADSPTGLNVSISVPTEGLETPTGISQSALKKAVVTLPQGMAVNPSAADGLGACALSQIKLGTNEPVQCPESSKIGSAEVVTPLLAEHLNGSVYLAKQGDNPFQSLLSLYLVVESKERGILVKIPGKVEADPQSGRLVATFDDNPQVPFSSLKLHFNEGNRAPLLNPPACGSYGIVSQLSPWSAPGQPRTTTSTFRVTEGPHGGPCPNGALEPKLEAGLQNPVAGTTSPFTLRLSREDGTQRFKALDVAMPPGLTAYLKGVPYCPDSALASVSEAEGTGRAQIEHPACPAASQIGTVSVGAGGGSNPFYVNTGRAYLAGPYKGAPLSIAIVTPAVAGPFDLGSVVVRSAVHVDPETARITVDSDPIPTILHGIPLDVRDIRVNVDRPHFTLAPTSCEAKAVAVRVTGEGGATASPTNHFQVGDCAALPFRPKLKLTLKGATGQAAHPALKAVVTYPAYSDTRCGPKGKRAKRLAAKAKRERRRAGRLEGAAARRARQSARRDARQARRLRGEARRCLAAVGPEANIARAQVNLPHAEFLDQGNLNKVCRKPVLLAGNCPRSSVYGRARAWTPLLDHPLEGYVYLVGGYGYKLPALVAELNGQIKVLLVGKVDSGKNHGIRNTFEVVPDAPVSRFVLEMKGGKKYGLLQNSEDLCEAKKSKRRAIVRFTGQNGKVEQFKPVVANQCGKQRKAKKKHGRHGEAKAGGGGKKGKGKG